MAEQVGFKAKVAKFVWGDTSKEERRLLRKLDFFILTYSCFSYFFNYLDRAAFANAYVAGLKEALDLTGSNYNVILSMAAAGMLVGHIPSSLIVQKVRPSIWMPSCVIAWAGFTMASAAAKNYQHLCVLRFFMGLAESNTYAGCMYVMGSWYKPDEIAKRAAMFTIAGQAGSMFAGAMMTAMHRSMNGTGGLAGWQWVFIIDGLMTMTIAVFGYLYFPDLPENTRASYLDERERKLALARLPPKREDGHNINPWSLAKRVLGKPSLYVCCAYSLGSAAFQAYSVQSLMLLYLKNRQSVDGWTQTQINTMPLGVQAMGIFSEIAVAAAMDYLGQRIAAGYTLLAIQAACSAVLLVGPNRIGGSGTLAVYYLAGSAYGINPLLYGWPTVILNRGGDDAARSVILACMSATGLLLYTFYGIVLYPADDAPYWRNGYIAMFCVIVYLGCMFLVIRWLDHRTQQLEEEQRRMDGNASNEEVVDEKVEEGPIKM